jgi:catechol 2,3-dioxygenase-like lactoylglutathione lyase family enzyme
MTRSITMKGNLYTWAGIMIIIMLALNQTPLPVKHKRQAMKLNAGIITPKLAESKDFYQKVLGCGVAFENDFYVLLHTPDGQTALSFLLPGHESQQPIFQTAFSGKGVYLTIEVDNVDAEYQRIKALGVDIAVPIRDEPWGDRHFAFYDPNGVGIDVVKYTAQ